MCLYGNHVGIVNYTYVVAIIIFMLQYFIHIETSQICFQCSPHQNTVTKFTKDYACIRNKRTSTWVKMCSYCKNNFYAYDEIMIP